MFSRFPSFWNRLAAGAGLAVATPQTQNGTHPEVKAAPQLPRLNGVEAEFFSPDGGHTIIPIGSGVGMAFAAYWYVAIRWRAQKIAEAPLMVVREDPATGSDEWLSDHELAGILDNPSDDYDMGELLERTSLYLDNTGACAWVKDRDGAGRVARLTPFSASEFAPKSDGKRLYASFEVKLGGGVRRTYPAVDVCYFRDFSETWNTQPRSRLSVAMDWLALGERARDTVYDMLANTVTPSLVVRPEKDWKPDATEFDRFKQELRSYATPGNKGKALVLLGGSDAESFATTMKDLVPSDILNRVESVVAAVSGVPSVVLQFQVGMENSPWSQMEQARRMAYDDTVQPMWRKLERTLTRQLLRPEEEDTTRFLRFDRSRIAALQQDQAKTASIIPMVARIATVNERRVIMGLEPSDDPAADEIPELTNPVPAPFVGGETKSRKARHRGVAVLASALREEDRSGWESEALRLLREDAGQIERIVRAKLKSAKAVSDWQLIMRHIDEYLRADVRDVKGRWGVVAVSRFLTAAERAIAVAAADMGIGYHSLHQAAVEFARREAGVLVTSIADTTREIIGRVISDGIGRSASVEAIARAVADSAAFTPARAKLIAQTESTRASAGGPVEALQAFAQTSGRVFTKRWSGMLDDRERDEHIGLEGETQYIENPFTNGLQYPSEPNCRCQLVLSEVTDE